LGRGEPLDLDLCQSPRAWAVERCERLPGCPEMEKRPARSSVATIALPRCLNHLPPRGIWLCTCAQRDEFHADQVGGTRRKRLSATDVNDAEADNVSPIRLGFHGLEFSPRWG
jgi:hypothetical protein